MSREKMEMVVLTDSAGNRYLLPAAGLEQARVPAEHEDQLEALIEESGTELDEREMETAVGGTSADPTGVQTVLVSPDFGGFGGNWSPPHLYKSRHG